MLRMTLDRTVCEHCFHTVWLDPTVAGSGCNLCRICAGYTSGILFKERSPINLLVTYSSALLPPLPADLSRSLDKSCVRFLELRACLNSRLDRAAAQHSTRARQQGADRAATKAHLALASAATRFSTMASSCSQASQNSLMMLTSLTVLMLSSTDLVRTKASCLARFEAPSSSASLAQFSAVRSFWAVAAHAHQGRD